MNVFLSDRLRAIIKHSGLKQKSFAEKVKVSPSLISDVVNGRCQLSERTAKIICDEYTVNVDWLLTGKGEMLTKSKVDRFIELTGGQKRPDILTRIAERKAPDYKPEPLTRGQRLLQAFALLDEERQERLIAMAEDMSTALLRGSDQEETGGGRNCAGSNEE